MNRYRRKQLRWVRSALVEATRQVDMALARDDYEACWRSLLAAGDLPYATDVLRRTHRALSKTAKPTQR